MNFLEKTGSRQIGPRAIFVANWAPADWPRQIYNSTESVDMAILLNVLILKNLKILVIFVNKGINLVILVNLMYLVSEW